MLQATIQLVSTAFVPRGELRFYLPSPHVFSLYSSCRTELLPSSKYGIAVPFLRRLEHSSLRTYDASQANITVLPALVDWYARGVCAGSWTDHLRNLTAEAMRAAEGGPQTPQMIIASDFLSFTRGYVQEIKKMLPGLRVGVYGAEVHMLDDCMFRTGHLTDVDAIAFRDAANLKRLQPDPRSMAPRRRSSRPFHVEFAGQVDNRTGYRDRYHFFHHDERIRNGSWITTSAPMERSGMRLCNASIPHDRLYCVIKVTREEMFAVRARGRYSLMLRGDDETSDRVQNAMMALAVPVVLGQIPLWLPFHFAVPWHKMIANVSAAAFHSHPAATLSALPHDVHSKQEQIAKHLHHFAFWPHRSWLHRNLLTAALAAPCSASPPRV